MDWKRVQIGVFFLVIIVLSGLGSVQAQDKPSSIMKAAGRGDIALLEKAVNEGENIEHKGLLEMTPLCLAARYGRIEAVKFLLDHGADIEARDFQGKTPLYIALCNGKKDVARLLIKRGANVEAKTKSGYTPLSYVATIPKSVELAAILIDGGADINTKLFESEYLIHIFAEKNSLELMKLFIEKGADLNLRRRRKKRYRLSALETAIIRGNQEIAVVLINSGANFKTNGLTSGLSPLCRAIQEGQTKVVRALIVKGVDVNRAPAQGVTPLHFACTVKEKGLELARMLIEAGANVHARTKDGVTPLVVSKRFKNKALTKFLIEKGATDGN